MTESIRTINYSTVNSAFSKQAIHYDEDDATNPILSSWRTRIYQHAQRYLKPNSYILELNAGTGIDAVHFAKQGHYVLATDLSDGMIHRIRQKINTNSLQSHLACQQCSFENLDQIRQNNFDYIFSNFGGLNCTDDLRRITRHFSALLKPGAYVTLVIMPPVCPWEILSIFKGNKIAFRRLKKGGTESHVEGEFFNSYYFTVSQIEAALGNEFRLMWAEGLGSLSPPPSAKDFPIQHPTLYQFMVGMEKSLKSVFPFNRWADHIITTFIMR